MSDPTSSRSPIPEELRKQLADFQQHLWRIKILEAVLAGVFGLIASFLLVFLLERFFPIPPLFRLVILIAGTSLASIFAPLWVRRWVYGHKREEQLARLISKKFPKLGDRLLGIVELQDQDESKQALSPELREAAMIHVANQAAKRDMADALPSSRHKKLAIGVGAAALITAFGFAISPKAGGNAFKRWLMPYSETEHYTFTQFDLDQIPDPLVIPWGEPFSITLPLKEKSDEKPGIASARYGGQDWLEASLGADNAYRFEFAGQQAKDQLTFKAGDATHRITVEPEERPAVTAFEAQVSLPDYLELQPRTIDVRTGTLTTLEGSKVVLKGTFNRELKSSEATFIPQTKEDLAEGFEQPNDAGQPETPEASALITTVSNNTLTTGLIELSDYPAEIPVNFTSIKGLAGASPFTVKVRTSQDDAPSSYLQGIKREVVILAKETLTFESVNEDDFGLKEIGIEWQGQFTTPTGKDPAKGEMILKKGSPSATRLTEKVDFSPLTHGIEPQRLILRGYAEDYKPGRGRIYSEPIVIYILTPDEHAQILKARFERVINELEDLARREQNNLDDNDRLNKLNDGEKLQNEDNQNKLAQQKEKEAENAEKMQDIAKKMEDIFKDAARNGNIDPKTMKQMQEAMQNMKELGEQDLPKVEEKLGETQNQKATPEKTKKNLKEAIAEQEEALKKMQDTIAKANDANENFEQSTFVNRLKKAASDEGWIANALINSFRYEESNDDQEGDKLIPILGARPGSKDLDSVYERLIKDLVKKQNETTTDVRWIQEDLERFHARTKKPEHKEIYEAMKASLIDIELENLREDISKNRTFTSTRLAKKWARLLKEWAEKLEGPKPEGGGGGGGGGGSQEEKDFEFMLKVLRMVQAEQDIRGRTRSLEQLMRSLNLRKQSP